MSEFHAIDAMNAMFHMLNNPRDDEWATEDDVVPEEPLRDDIMFWPDGAKTRNHELDDDEYADCPDCRATGIGYNHEPRSCGRCAGRGSLLPEAEDDTN